VTTRGVVWRTTLVVLVAAAVAAAAVARHGGGDPDAEAVAARWVEVHNGRLAECSVLDLYSDGYLEANFIEAGRCEQDPTSFFTYWFTESETQGSSYELGDVRVDGEEAVAEVREEGGLVPELRLLLVSEDDGWRIDAVGAAL
jgi:hypothetical protein